VEIADDGIGGAGGPFANGLAALDDRVSALGGRLLVRSPRAQGTRVSVSLPLAE
jgi:signal transduction histidine kinase